ncbi:MAG: hypothetical protein HYZ28_11425 [Myxococcales bacterium]|nr:hypothetical protein [Myxococcales bacterium]
MFLSLLALVLANAPVDPPAQDLERFKAHFTQGEQFFEQGEYGAAIWHFRQADLIRVTPEVAFDLAKCHEKLGDLAFSTYYYRLYLRRSPTAKDALDVAEKVGAALALAEGEGRGLLEAEGGGLHSASVAGKAFPELPLAVFLPPGDYELLAQFPGGPHKRLVQIRTGKTHTVPVEPLPPPLLDAASATPQWAAADGSKPVNARGVVRTASYAVLGASVVALAAGTAMGAMAASDKSRLDNDRASLTYGDAKVLAAAANGKGGWANALWIAGGVGALGGGAMFVFTLPEPGAKRGGDR